jgi:catechol 2,3-dioxygenase-like lactoylglutathione lyase family enzyme
MNIEHIALNVADPVAMAQWHCRHLGMRVVRQVDGPPFTRFVADEAGRVVLELYHQNVPVPDYAGLDPMVLHVAFAVADVNEARQKLLAAGATAAGDVVTTPTGDQYAMVRDPWGLVIQLVHRATPLLGAPV